MRHRNFSRRPIEPTGRSVIARKKKKAEEAESKEHKPGQLSGTLRRRMGEALANLFDEFGPDIYSEVVLSLKEIILEKFEDGFNGLDEAIKEELGNRGVTESREHIREWASEIVEDVNHYGLDEVAGALEDRVGSLTAEYVQPNEGDDVLEVSPDDVEEIDVVEEEEVEPDAEVTDEEVAPAEMPDLNLDDVEVPNLELGARLGHRRQRRRPSRFSR